MSRISDAWLYFGIFDNILTTFKDTKGLNISEKQSWWQSSTDHLIFMGNFNEVSTLGVVVCTVGRLQEYSNRSGVIAAFVRIIKCHHNCNPSKQASCPPRFLLIKRCRWEEAMRRITTCPPRFLDFATCLNPGVVRCCRMVDSVPISQCVKV